MSGIEVVGLVLGTIPLILTAIEKYKAVQSWKKYSRELSSLRRSLSANLKILESTLERLLTGLVAETELEEMISEPFGPLWKDKRIHGAIRTRLWNSYKIFEDTVEDMNEAIEQVGAKLNAFHGARSTSNSLVGGLERVKFAFNRLQYSEMIKVVTESNETLIKLLDQGVNEKMESSRQIRSAGRFFSLTRRLSRNVFNAIRCSLSCRCPVSHSVNLELQVPTVRPTPSDNDEAVVRQIFFRLMLMYDANSHKAKQTTWLWDEVEVRAEVEKSTESADVVAGKPSPNSHGKPKKRVNFASSQSFGTNSSPGSPGFGSQVQTIDGIEVLHKSLTVAMTGLSVGAAAFGMPNLDGKMRHLENLCHAIEESKRSTRLSALDCYGYVTDKSATTYNRFGVYPVQHSQAHYNITGEWSIVSLRQVLENGGKSLPRLAFRHKQTLAATIASNVLQLAKPPLVTRKREQPKSISHQGGNIKPNQDISGMIQNHTIFSLGIVLLELALGKRLSSMRKPTTTTTITTSATEEGPHQQESGLLGEADRRRDLLLDYDTALQHLSVVNTEMGPYYHDAVRRCIKCEFMHPTLDLEDDEFRQEVYKKVVALLEKNLKDMNSSTKSFTQ
ncbi:alpha/beta knot [Apiospora arundinis]